MPSHRRRVKLSAIVRNTAVPEPLWAKQGRRTEPYRTMWADCQLTADTLRPQKQCAYQRRNFGTEKEFRNRWTENFPDENVLPPTARVSAEARDENG